MAACKPGVAWTRQVVVAMLLAGLLSPWMVGAQESAKPRGTYQYYPIAPGVSYGQYTVDEATVHQPVGRRGRRDLVAVLGLKVLNPVAVRDKLFKDGSVLNAAHPRADWSEYIRTLQQRLLTGLQYSGFPDATVKLESTEPDGIRLVVHEGPRYLAGQVEIVDARHLPVDRVIRMLTADSPKRVEYDSDTGTHALLPHTSKAKSCCADGEQTPPVWLVDQPARCSHDAMKKFASRFARIAQRLGYFLVEANVEWVRNPETMRIVPKIRIKSEGPRTRIEQIEITGLKRIHQAHVREFLKIHEGMPFEADMIAEWDHAIRQSGRFLRASTVVEPVELETPPSMQLSYSSIQLEGIASEAFFSLVPSPKVAVMERMRLRLEFEELQDISGLNVAFTPVESAAMQHVRWMQQLADSGDDVVFQAKNPAAQQIPQVARIELIHSAKSGTLLRLLDHDNRWLHAIVAADGDVRFYARRTKRMVTSQGKANVWLAISAVAMEEQNSDGENFRIGINGGFSTGDRRKLDCGQQGRLPSMVRFTIDPAVEMALSSDPEFQTVLEGEELIRTTEDMVRVTDAATGRLIRWHSKESKDKWMVKGEQGAFDAALAELNAETADFADQFEGKMPVSSVGRFLAEELIAYVPTADLRQASADDNVATLSSAGAVLGLLVEQILRPIDEQHRLSSSVNQLDHFTIPQNQRTTQNDFVAVLLQLGLPISDQLFAQGTWPHEVIRDALHRASGNGDYWQQTLMEAVASDTMGPLGCLAVAHGSVHVSPFGIPLFAEHGLAHLDEAGLHRDLQVLLGGETIMADATRRAAAVLRDLDPAELAKLEALWGPQWQGQVELLAAALRRRADLPLDDAITAAADELWPTHIEPWLRAELEEMRKHPLAPGNAGQFNAGGDPNLPDISNRVYPNTEDTTEANSQVGGLQATER